MSTSEYLTKYEKAKVLGRRAAQIDKGSMPLCEDKIGNPYDLALRELHEGKIHMKLRRFFQDGTYEEVKVKNLKLP